MIVRLTLLITAINILTHTIALKISCKNEDNNDVDWFYLYKLPRIHSNAIDTDHSGMQYVSIVPETLTSGNWQLSNRLINSPSSFPGRTLGPLFDDPDVLLIAYNDEHPAGHVDFDNGHTKGVLATDGTTGIWLIHSVPKYPNISEYTYPATGTIFGQSFLCITFNASTQMDIVAKQLVYNEPAVYFSRIPKSLAGKYPDISKIISEQWVTVAPFHNLVEFRSLSGTVFKSFAKGRHFNAELYGDWVAPTLSNDLLVETWRNSPNKLPSNCSKQQKVFNVAMVDDQKLDIAFKSTADHSKWAVTVDGEDDWICVGDINRDTHQFVRGGGTVCQNNLEVTKIYRSTVGKYDKCMATCKTESELH